MIALIIIGVLLALIAAILILPIVVDLSCFDGFGCKVYFSGILIFDSLKHKKKPEKVKKKAEKGNTPIAENQNKKTGFFAELKEKAGFTGAVKEILDFAKLVLSDIKKTLKKITFKVVKLDISIASGNAAATAIAYGAACAAAYPVLSLIEANSKVEYKSVNIKSDFNSEKPQFSFEVKIGLKIVYFLVSAVKVFKDYKAFKERIEQI